MTTFILLGLLSFLMTSLFMFIMSFHLNIKVFLILFGLKIPHFNLINFMKSCVTMSSNFNKIPILLLFHWLPTLQPRTPLPTREIIGLVLYLLRGPLKEAVIALIENKAINQFIKKCHKLQVAFPWLNIFTSNSMAST